MIGSLFMSILILATAGDTPKFGVPPPITSCLKMAGDQYRLSNQVNPYYVRGDFWAIAS
jgi:hypothetical protein